MHRPSSYKYNNVCAPGQRVATARWGARGTRTRSTLPKRVTLSVPSEMAEDGRWRGDVRPARQASRRPPPVLPRSKRNGSRSVLVSLVSDPQDTPSECPPSCAPSRGPDGTGAAGSCVEVSPPEPSLRRWTRIIRAFDRTHSRARAENAQVACPTPPDPAASDQHEGSRGGSRAARRRYREYQRPQASQTP